MLMDIPQMWRDRILIEPFFMATSDSLGDPLQTGASFADNMLAFHHLPGDHVTLSALHLLPLNRRARWRRRDGCLTTLTLASTTHATLTLALTLTLTLALALTLALTLTLTLALKPGGPLREALSHFLASTLRLI